jgi:hypothetical protein
MFYYVFLFKDISIIRSKMILLWDRTYATTNATLYDERGEKYPSVIIPGNGENS